MHAFLSASEKPLLTRTTKPLHMVLGTYLNGDGLTDYAANCLRTQTHRELLPVIVAIEVETEWVKSGWTSRTNRLATDLVKIRNCLVQNPKLNHSQRHRLLKEVLRPFFLNHISNGREILDQFFFKCGFLKKEKRQKFPPRPLDLILGYAGLKHLSTVAKGNRGKGMKAMSSDGETMNMRTDIRVLPKLPETIKANIFSYVGLSAFDLFAKREGSYVQLSLLGFAKHVKMHSFQPEKIQPFHDRCTDVFVGAAMPTPILCAWMTQIHIQFSQKQDLRASVKPVTVGNGLEGKFGRVFLKQRGLDIHFRGLFIYKTVNQKHVMFPLIGELTKVSGSTRSSTIELGVFGGWARFEKGLSPTVSSRSFELESGGRFLRKHKMASRFHWVAGPTDVS
ncbi:MAG: hypothetical protein ACI9BD_000547 [Candidatus Marinamargulisbacteria bacterium]|jgi:hypothetical protein